MKIDDDQVIRRFQELAREEDSSAPPAALQRWRRALDDEASRVSRPGDRSNFQWLSFPLAASLPILVMLIIGGLLPRDDRKAPEGTVAEARFERGLQVHLAELESQLTQAAALPAAERADAIRNLALQNRMQAAVADRVGGARDARVLRAFTVALEEMAADANGAFKGALAQLHFEVKVTQARLASRSPSTGAHRFQAL